MSLFDEPPGSSDPGHDAARPLADRMRPATLDEFFGHLESDFDNPISRIIEDISLDEVLKDDPDLVAICIPFNEQLVEGFAFLKQLKQRAPHIKTIVGGAIKFLSGSERSRHPSTSLNMVFRTSAMASG